MPCRIKWICIQRPCHCYLDLYAISVIYESQCFTLWSGESFADYSKRSFFLQLLVGWAAKDFLRKAVWLIICGKSVIFQVSEILWLNLNILKNLHSHQSTHYICIADKILCSAAFTVLEKAILDRAIYIHRSTALLSLSSPFMVNPSAYKSVTATAQILEAQSVSQAYSEPDSEWVWSQTPNIAQSNFAVLGPPRTLFLFPIKKGVHQGLIV